MPNEKILNIRSKRCREELCVPTGMLTRSKRRKLDNANRCLNVRVVVKKLSLADIANACGLNENITSAENSNTIDQEKVKNVFSGTINKSIESNDTHLREDKSTSKAVGRVKKSQPLNVTTSTINTSSAAETSIRSRSTRTKSIESNEVRLENPNTSTNAICRTNVAKSTEDTSTSTYCYVCNFRSIYFSFVLQTFRKWFNPANAFYGRKWRVLYQQ